MALHLCKNGVGIFIMEMWYPQTFSHSFPFVHFGLHAASCLGLPLKLNIMVVLFRDGNAKTITPLCNRR